MEIWFHENVGLQTVWNFLVTSISWFDWKKDSDRIGINLKVPSYSTVPELEVNKVWSIDSSNQIDFDKLILSFTLTVNVGGLINKHNYKLRQQQLYSLIKNYKDNQHLSYKRISELLFKDGYRSIRKNKVLKPNYVWSIYKKGQQRDKRISSYLRTYSNIILIVK